MYGLTQSPVSIYAVLHGHVLVASLSLASVRNHLFDYVPRTEKGNAYLVLRDFRPLVLLLFERHLYLPLAVKLLPGISPSDLILVPEYVPEIR